MRRGAFTELLDRVGTVLIKESAKLAKSEGPVRKFLKANPTSPGNGTPYSPRLSRVLPCAQRGLSSGWPPSKRPPTATSSAVSHAISVLRWGKRARSQENRSGANAVLHHPVRDGRPPIALSKVGHWSIEEQVVANAERQVRTRAAGDPGRAARFWRSSAAVASTCSANRSTGLPRPVAQVLARSREKCPKLQRPGMPIYSLGSTRGACSDLCATVISVGDRIQIAGRGVGSGGRFTCCRGTKNER